MKIAIVSPRIPPIGYAEGLVGGGETYPLNLAIALARLKHYITIITASKKENEYYLNDHLRIKYAETNIFSVNPYDPFSFKLVKALTSNHYDVIHAHQLFTSFNILSCSAGRIRKIPSFLTDHGGGSTFLAAVPSICAKFPLSFIAVSEFSRKWLHCFDSSKKSFVVYGGVDTNFFHPNYKVTELKNELDLGGFHVVLYVGRILPHKGVEMLIKSLLHLPQNIKLLIVGPIKDSDYFEYLRKLADKIAPKRILFTGYVESYKLPEFYNLCDIFVLPSVYHDYRRNYHRFPELFGLTKFEAMACGKPAVVSNVGGLPEQIIDGKNGFIVRAGDEIELAETVNKLLEDEKLRKNIAREGLKLVQKNFTWEAVAKHVAQCYKSV